ncbi:MAG: PD40 domain-containing protein [Gemmatimonadaceae bacterium]|nr:PD40 domain-containing protein [Gemmatimonadaceae bacterium]
MPQGAAQEVVISPDGRTALYRVTSKRRGDIYYSTISGDGDPRPFAAGPGDEHSPKFSRDGRWVAYVSDESGTIEVYVRKFPGPGGRLQVSAGGGGEPVWAHDGRRVFYRNGQNIFAASLAGTEALEVAGRSIRLRGDFAYTDRHANYDVSPDGTQILVPKTVGQQSRMVWVVNWAAEVRDRVQAGRKTP